MKILVCDDVRRRGEETVRAIASATRHEPTLVCGEPLTEAIRGLFDYARSVLQKPTTGADEGPPLFGPPYELTVLDNNLSELEIAGARHTAESIAGYVRAFGRIPYVVSLNKNPDVDFDLRYLVGDYRTHTDLAVNDPHLSNAGLWTGHPQDTGDPFLPWYWPSLDRAPDRRRQQVAFVGVHLDEPILKSMAFPPSAAGYFSRHASGALSPRAESTSSVTFLRFFREACHSLPNMKERQKLARAASRNEGVRAFVSRVVAAEMDRWIRRDLLGPQDVLVDVPHLLVRMPFLLGSRADDLRYWNKAVVQTEPPYGLSEELYENYLKENKFAHDSWTKGPCFWWRALKTNSELNRLFDTQSRWADAVFCEDLSRFVGATSDRAPETTEFAAEFEGAWNRRHIAYLDEKQYAPKSRLAK